MPTRSGAAQSPQTLGLNPQGQLAPKQWASICGKRVGVGAVGMVKGADNCRWVQSGGFTRRYIAYVPPGTTPRAVVIMLHGGGQTGEQHHAISGWRELAERERFIAVFPSGLTYTELGGDARPHWNDFSLACEIGPKPADWPSGAAYPADDEVFIDDVLADLRRHSNVDPKRIFVSGFSNGSAMAKTLGINRTSTFAAVGSWAGSIAPCEQNGTVVRPAVAPHLQQPAARAIPTAWGLGAADPHILDKYNELRSAQGLPASSNVPVTVDFVNSVPGQRLLRTEEDVEANGLVFGPAAPIDISTWAGIGPAKGPNPKYVSVQWTQAAVGNTAGNNYSYVLLKDVEHHYPNASKSDPRRTKLSNGVSAAEVFWHFFTLHPKP